MDHLPLTVRVPIEEDNPSICRDEAKCIKCGMCGSMCSENLSFDKDGKSDVINETVTENTKNTAECCPTGAIEIKEV